MGLWEQLKAKHDYKSLGKPRLNIGIPTINCVDLLKENLEDLSKNLFSDIHKLIIKDNGKQDIESIIPTPLLHCTTVHTEDENLGVSGSWNKIIEESYYKTSPADHLLLLNDDVVLGKTFEELEAVFELYPQYTLINCTYYWSVFLISRECIDTVGYFDAKFFPAYFEDNDYARRHALEWGRNPKKERKECQLLNPIVKRNSSTIRKSPSLNQFFGKNANYYRAKWGGNLGNEQFTVPFNGQEVDN